MIAKTIKFTDLDGEQREETHYFNLTETELLEWEFSKNGGMSELLKKIAQEQDTNKIVGFIQDIILKAYGEKAADGKHFNKSKKIRKKFKNSLAYNALFMELATDATKAADFVNGIIPTKISAEAQKLLAANSNNA